MRNCFPDEVFNTIPFTYSGDDLAASSVAPFIQESVYKLPNVKDVTIEREFWHALCDFAERTGLLLEKATSTSGTSLSISPTFGRFWRVVGASELSSVTEDGNVTFKNAGSNYVIYSVIPDITLSGSDTVAAKHVAPKWFLKKYQKVIMNAAMIRLSVMIGDEAAARMAATAYSNDIRRCTAGFLTSGMRKQIEIDFEDVLASVSKRVVEKQEDK